MLEGNIPVDNRIHIRLKRHLIKHGKRLHAHIKKHHKKYLLWWTLYGVSHIIILKVLALKLLLLKWLIVGLTFVGITNPSLTDIFAKMDNICIDNTPIIANQLCEKNFNNIQDAVVYLESMIDPETDTIYNAQYYGIIKSVLGEYCSKEINKDEIDIEKNKIDDIEKTQDLGEKTRKLEDTNTLWKEKSLESNFSGEVEFCNQKYLAYDMLDLTKTLFLKAMNKWNLLNPTPILPGQSLRKKSDKFILDNFIQRKEDNNNLDIKYTLGNLWSTNANNMANIIKNISVKATYDSISALNDMWIITDTDKQTIKGKLSLSFVWSCEKNSWYHKINQYYDDKDILQKTTLEDIGVNIWLCNSYQYIDQLEQQVKKLVIHEIGHYIYYFKDTSPKQFAMICRNKEGTTEKNTCNSDAFISTYAQTNSEEDYAETFSRWALSEANKEYLPKDTDVLNWSVRDASGGVITGEIHPSAEYRLSDGNSILSRKFNYFERLLPTSKHI